VLSAFATELFPTAVRAQASGWIRNAWGTTGSVVGPTMVGVLGAAAGPLHDIGDAMTVTALLLLVAVPIIWAMIPETRGVSLDETDIE